MLSAAAEAAAENARRQAAWTEWRDDWGDACNFHSPSPAARATLARPARTAASSRSTSRQPRRLRSREPSKEPSGLPLFEATGRVVARDVLAPIDLPPFDNSAMDGYAVRCADLDGRRTVAAFALPAGSPQATRLRLSARRTKVALRIFTGAPVPRASTRWSCRSIVNATADRSSSASARAPGENIRHAGEDVRSGTRILDGR